jgi:hypothetical protein
VDNTGRVIGTNEKPDAEPAQDTNRNRMIADLIKQNAPMNNSPTNAAWAAQQYDSMTKAPTATLTPQDMTPIGSTNTAPISMTNTTTRVPAFAAPSAAPAAIAIPVVNSQNDYDALPVGQPYKDSLGRVATKKAPVQNGGGFQIQIPGAMQPGQ